jgi:hypothetical protein
MVRQYRYLLFHVMPDLSRDPGCGCPRSDISCGPRDIFRGFLTSRAPLALVAGLSPQNHVRGRTYAWKGGAHARSPTTFPTSYPRRHRRSYRLRRVEVRLRRSPTKYLVYAACGVPDCTLHHVDPRPLRRRPEQRARNILPVTFLSPSCHLPATFLPPSCHLPAIFLPLSCHLPPTFLPRRSTFLPR